MCFSVAFFSVIVSVTGSNDREAWLAVSASAPNLNTLTKCRCPQPPLATRWKTLDWGRASFIVLKSRCRSRAPIRGSDQYCDPSSLPGTEREGERCKPDADRWPSCQTCCTYKGSLWWMAVRDYSFCMFVYKNSHFPALLVSSVYSNFLLRVLRTSIFQPLKLKERWIRVLLLLLPFSFYTVSVKYISNELALKKKIWTLFSCRFYYGSQCITADRAIPTWW